MAEKELSFEAAVEKLEAIVKKLEEGDVTLEEALESFQEGVAMLQHCNKRLAEVEAKMNVLLDESGELKLVPFAEQDGVK
ncbi:MAG: exodeoxyribonuclease VII small subunit [Thermoanaerobacteraceae bacterium]|nr:exodeoxyribonuclease VII small subunit [Thermoanaerobacteraceae bacterium]